MTYDYFYGQQADQFSFYRIPKALFTDEAFDSISLQICLTLTNSFSEYDTCYSDYSDYPYYHSYTMDAYQNLISGDKRSKITQGNCSGWLLP